MNQPLRLSAGHRHFDHRAAPFVAVAHGWFAEEGLDDPVVTASGEDDVTVAALLDGSIDVGLDIFTRQGAGETIWRAASS